MKKAKDLNSNCELTQVNCVLTDSEMIPLTEKEGEVLLLVFKDFSVDYNANKIAQKLEISRFGALKIVKALKKRELLVSRQYGGATFYKANLSSEYGITAIKFLLMNEAYVKAGRWLFHFREWRTKMHALIVFGSVVRDYKKANDIDVVAVVDEGAYKQRKDLLKPLDNVSLKPHHVVWQAKSDLVKNLQKPDPVLLSALRFGYVLHGYDRVVGAVKKAQEKHGMFSVPEPEERHDDPLLN